jgi:hypothetical protein
MKEMQLLTVDNEIATIKKNKVVAPGSRFDGRMVKSNKDISRYRRTTPQVQRRMQPQTQPQAMPPRMPNVQANMAQPNMMQGQAKPMTPKSMQSLLKANLMGLI